MSGLVSQEELLQIADFVRSLDKTKYRVRSQLSGIKQLRNLGPEKAFDPEALRKFEFGDQLKDVIWRRYVVSKELVVRSYRRTSELVVQIELDSFILLYKNRQIGPFTVKLAFLLSVSALLSSVPVEILLPFGKHRLQRFQNTREISNVANLLSKLTSDDWSEDTQATGFGKSSKSIRFMLLGPGYTGQQLSLIHISEPTRPY